MPIYEYACTACEHELEAIQKMSDEPLLFCPECGEQALKKKISAAGFQLKGGGWYETDFKGSGKSTDNGQSKSEKATKSSHSCPAGGCGCG